MIKNIVLLTFILISAKSFSCEFDTPKDYALFTSLESNQTHAFDHEKTLYELPIFRAFNCQKVALKNQFIMIGIGPELNEFDDQVQSFSFSDEIYPSKCSIKNAPFAVMSFDEKLKIFKSKKDYINNCLEIIIEDEGRMPLKITEEQPGCKVNKVTNHKAIYQGGFCFVKPTITSSYLVKVKVKKECQTRDGLKALKLNPTDIKSIINFYSAGDETGSSGQLQALNTTNMRLITNTDASVIKSSDSYGEINPQFPADYINPNIYMAETKIQEYGPNFKFETPILVDNRCKETCLEGLCYSPCQYAQPAVFEAQLFSVSKRKESFLTSWYDGGVAQPNYQGFINGTGFLIPKTYLEDGKVYKLVLNFNDPKFDFEKFKDRIVRKFGEMRQHLPQMNRNGISDIPEINEIISLAQIPSIRDIYGINFAEGLEGLTKSLELLRSYLGYKMWPPYYDQTCSADMTKCMSSSMKNLEIIYTFKLNIINDTPSITTINMERKSKLEADYINTKLPKLECGYKK